jgi:hypothetical protein
MSGIKLKNCPFCGCEARLSDRGFDNNKYWAEAWCCTGVECSGLTSKQAKEKVAEIWNKRVNDNDQIK